jgi:broad specificity phosphatase PhoE
MAFTEEQKQLLYWLGLDPDRVEERDAVLAEMAAGRCMLSDGKVSLKGCTLASDARSFAMRLLERKGVSSDVLHAVEADTDAWVTLERITAERWRLTVTYQPTVLAISDSKEVTEVTPIGVEYLDGVEFVGGSAVKERLMETMGLSVAGMRQRLDAALASLKAERTPCTSDKESEWLACRGECSAAAREGIEAERGSTAYMLRCLAQGMLSVDGKTAVLRVRVEGGEPLTGRWSDDEGRLFLEGEEGPGGRLVMGFGPSASGKTYLTSTLLSLLRQADPTLPSVFFSIDGDVYRSSSLAYQEVKEAAYRVCAQGFDNLVSSGVSAMLGSLFEAKVAIRAVLPFLARQKTAIHLYIPETLGGCLVGSCESVYKAYKDLTKDPKWIGLLIWQHRKGKECNFPVGWRCRGCTESGLSRQKMDGKKYSNTAWENSMTNGRAEFVKAPGGAYLIHNSGQKGSTSVIVDYGEASQAKKGLFMAQQESRGYTYVVHAEAVQEIEMRLRRARTIKEEQKQASTEVDIQAYEQLLKETQEPLHAIYRALYPKEMEPLDRAMTKLGQRLGPVAPSADRFDTFTVVVYYIRHGYSCANYARNVATGVKKALHAHSFLPDPPLHTLGIQQAVALGRDIAAWQKSGETVDALVTSQLYRAIQTGLLLRSQLDSAPVFQVVPHLAEKGWTTDNKPDKILRITDEEIQREELDLVVDRSSDRISDFQAFEDGPLRRLFHELHAKDPSQRTFRVFVVSHSTLLKEAIGTKPDNCQLLPVTYTMTGSGALLGRVLPRKEDMEAVRQAFPSPYRTGSTDKAQEANTSCEDVNPLEGLRVERLLKSHTRPALD